MSGVAYWVKNLKFLIFFVHPIIVIHKFDHTILVYLKNQDPYAKEIKKTYRAGSVIQSMIIII